MSSIEINESKVNSDAIDQFHPKEVQIVNTSKDSDNISTQDNQHSIDDQNSSSDIQKGADCIYQKENEQSIDQDKNPDHETQSTFFMTEGNTKENEQKQQTVEEDQNQNEQSELNVESEDQEENIKLLVQQVESQETEQQNQPKEKTTEQILKESKELDERVQQMIKSTQSSIQKTLDSTNKTLQSVAQTMKDIDETNKKFDNFNAKSLLTYYFLLTVYTQTMNQFGEKLAEAFGQGNLNNEDDFMPQVSDIEEIAQTLKYKTEVVFLLSKSLLNGEKNNLQQKDYFDKYNDEFWKMYGIVQESMQMSGPNEVDNNITSIVNSLQNASTNSTLITTSIEDGLRASVFQNIKKDEQESREIGCKNFNEEQKENIEEMMMGTSVKQMASYDHKCRTYDDEEQKSTFKEMESQEKGGDQFDFDLFSGKYNYFQIHGNINFLRCSNSECENKNKPQFLSPTGPIFNKPHCQLCKSPMRPHFKFNDEENDENMYNIDWVKARINQLDCLVLVGLDEDEKNEPLYKELIQKSIEYGILIIEISMQPHLEIGYIRQLIGFPQEMLMFLRDQLLYG